MWVQCCWDSKNTCCWTKTGLLSRIRPGITCTGSSTKCNPLISLLCAAQPGSQVVPICPRHPPHTHSGGIGLLQITDTIWEPGCAYWNKEIKLRLKLDGYLCIFSSHSFFTNSIDFYSLAHLATPANLAYGCHKKLLSTEVSRSNGFLKQWASHCVSNENDSSRLPPPSQGRRHLSVQRVISQPQSPPAMLWQMSADDLARCYNSKVSHTTLGLALALAKLSLSGLSRYISASRCCLFL